LEDSIERPVLSIATRMARAASSGLGRQVLRSTLSPVVISSAPVTLFAACSI
jgi:hypothetical protein